MSIIQNIPTELSLNLSDINFAIVRQTGQKLGNCYNQTNLLIYSIDNVDDAKWDHVYAEENKSYNRRKKLLEFLPVTNTGSELGKFEKVENYPNLFVAKYWYRTDSGD